MSLDVYLKTKKCPHCGRRDELWHANITHNLVSMAAEAGIYDIVWHPENLRIRSAGRLIGPLTDAISVMRADPERFKIYNPENNWGDYDGFVAWLDRYLDACKEHKNAVVETST